MPEAAVYAIVAVACGTACRRLSVRPDLRSAGLGALLSALQLVGACYRDSGTWRALVATPAAAAASLALLLLGAFALSLLCALLLRLMSRAGERAAGGARARFPPTPAVFLMLLVAWAPYLWAFRPGSLTYDGTYQLDVFYGLLPRTDHHPYLMTLLMGSVFDLGRRLGSDGLGVALWVGLQTLLQALALSLSVGAMRRTGAPAAALVAATAFLALAPAWGAYAQAFCKDTLFASLLCLYVTQLFEAWWRDRRGEPLSPARAAGLLALGCALCAARHNGAYVVALSLPAQLLSLSHGRSRRLAAAAAAGALALQVAVSSVVLPALGVAPAGRQEALGSLVQMTARCLRECPDDVEDWEREAIEAVLDYEGIADLYDPSTSDPVKATWHGGDADVPAYLAAWASMGARHPGVYLDALLAGCWGYLYVGTAPTHRTWDYRLYQSDPIAGTEDAFDVPYASPEPVRSAFISALNAFQCLPVIGLVGHCGIYAWALLLAMACALRSRGASGLMVAAPSAVMLLICLVSPVNGYLRYALPVMAACPVTLWASCLAAGGDGARSDRPAHLARGARGSTRPWRSRPPAGTL